MNKETSKLLEAQTAMRERDFVRAIQLLETLLRIDPENKDALKLLRFARVGSGQSSPKANATMAPVGFKVLKKRKKRS